ncbi:hypothetical protein DNTS_029993 [Danionella cerebrum]|uniref:Uncharacterized protein n=1 Tax=Danionella cerebrum TaxID=2873325 RepID=A0A553QF78_9TELE|nr:hypothetical protein DNTS_029993 [Danionella translucida]
MRSGSMGCGGSRSASVEPRYHESRDTESTWLTSTDHEMPRPREHGNGTGARESENTPAAGPRSGQREEKMTSRSHSVQEKKLVTTGTQCSRNSRETEVRDTEEHKQHNIK